MVAGDSKAVVGMRKYLGSEVLYRSYPRMFREHPIRFILYVLMIPILYGIYLLVRWWFDNYATRLILTDDLVVLIRGIFNTRVTEIRMTDIRSVRIEQRFMEHVFRVGTIQIASAGSDGYEIAISGMPNPTKVQRIINERRVRGGGSDD